jgi:hypothetical protein
MALGPGKYDDACTVVREMTNADCVMVVVLGGDKGNGFSVQTVDPSVVDILSDLLEHMAKQLREK